MVEPGALALGQLGLEQPDGHLSQRVVVRVSLGSHRGLRPDLLQPLRVADGQVLRALVGMVDESLQAGSSRAQIAMSRASSVSSARMVWLSRQPTIHRVKTSTTKAT